MAMQGIEYLRDDQLPCKIRQATEKDLSNIFELILKSRTNSSIIPSVFYHLVVVWTMVGITTSSFIFIIAYSKLVAPIHVVPCVLTLLVPSFIFFIGCVIYGMYCHFYQIHFTFIQKMAQKEKTNENQKPFLETFKVFLAFAKKRKKDKMQKELKDIDGPLLGMYTYF